MLGNGISIRLTDRAEADVDLLIAQYNDSDINIGDRFSLDFYNRLESLQGFWAYEMGRNGTRKIAMDNFPYLIYYVVDEAIGSLIIESVMHQNQLPRYN